MKKSKRKEKLGDEVCKKKSVGWECVTSSPEVISLLGGGRGECFRSLGF